MNVYKIRKTSGLSAYPKIYRTRGHAQSQITNMVRERVRRYGYGTEEELGKEYEIVEYELIEIISIPYTSLKVK